MKYADKVIELMAAMPGRDFRMVEIVRYVAPGRPSVNERRAVRKGVLRVIQQLQAAGVVLCRPARLRGGYARYRWK